MPQPQECRAFTQKHNGLSNRIISNVRISEAFDPKTPPVNPHLFETRALWDTGATHSVITAATAKTLGLIPTGKGMVQHAGGKGDFNTYVVNFFLPNQVAIIGVRVTECPHLEGCGAIIGMDIIMGGDMSISNHQGETWFTFRWPSFGAIDYVADINKARSMSVPRVGRNDPCSCGSGKKYKKCHGL
jgi:hypothetical protein